MQKVINLAKSQPAGTAVLLGSLIGLGLGTKPDPVHHDDHHAPAAATAHVVEDVASVAAGANDAELPKITALEPHSPLHGRANDVGLPSDSNVRYFKDYVAGVDFERKIPKWVYQSLNREQYRAEYSEGVTRKKSRFSDNVYGVPVAFRATNDDYKGSGLTRGHMAPASDSKSSTQEGMNETFLLAANIVPQEWNSNSNFWYRMEVFARKGITENFDQVDVVSGPLFLPNDDGVVSYRVIGENKVAVPTHLYKVVSASIADSPDRFQAAFVVPNGPVSPESKITDFQVPLENVEKSSGLQFFAAERKDAKDLCATWDCDGHFLTDSGLKEWNLSRRLSWANSEAELIGIWENADKEGIKKTPAAHAMYSKRLASFEQ